MDEEQDKRSELLRLWHEYGKAYTVFVPAEQPDPHDWDRPLPQPDEKGTLDPLALKHSIFRPDAGFPAATICRPRNSRRPHPDIRLPGASIPEAFGHTS